MDGDYDYDYESLKTWGGGGGGGGGGVFEMFEIPVAHNCAILPCLATQSMTPLIVIRPANPIGLMPEGPPPVFHLGLSFVVGRPRKDSIEGANNRAY